MESVLDDSGDISEDDEYDDDKQAELTETGHERESGDSEGVEERDSGDSEGVEEDELNDTDMKMKESDEGSTPTSNKKAKVTQKPRGAEYKLIR